MDPTKATSISVDICEHGTLWLMLHGEDGEAFAYGTLDPETAITLGEQINDLLTEWVEKTLAERDANARPH